MKLKIDKQGGGRIEITIIYDTGRKPLKLDVGDAELAGLLRILYMVRRTDTFVMELQLGK